MRFYRTFGTSMYLMVALGLWIAATAEQNMIPLLGLPVLALAYYYGEIRGRAFLSSRTATYLALAAFCWAWVENRLLGTIGSFSLTHFLIVVQLIMLLQKPSNRNYAVALLICLLNAWVASALTTELAFALQFIAFTVLGIWTLTLMHIKQQAEAEEAAMAETRPAQLERWRSFRGAFACIVVLSLVVLGVAAATFTLVPRLPAPQITRPGEAVIGVTGFSEDVHLGDIGQIKESAQKVMRIWIYENGVPVQVEGIHVRGVALTYYDGSSWRVSSPTGVPAWRRQVSHQPWRPRLTSYQEIELELVAGEALFAVYPESYRRQRGVPAVSFWLDERQNLVEDTLTDAVKMLFAPLRQVKYQAAVTGETGGRERTLPSVPLNPEAETAFLQLPEGLSPRIAELAESVAPRTRYSSDLERADAIESYLESTYGYTLTPPVGGDSEPVAEFLFETRTGYCEHFASAMVLMLRTLGIPARLVNGYLGGEWNDVGEYYLIRQQDAHSWVEAYFPDRGWTTFDPTPAAGTNIYPTRGVWPRVSGTYDAVERLWVRRIVNYGDEAQQEITRRFLRSLVAAASRVNGAASAIPERTRDLGRGFPAGQAGLLALLVLGAGLTAALFLVPALKKLRPGRVTRRAIHPRPRVEFYERMTRILARRGFRRLPGSTPLEFAREVVALGGAPYGPVIELARIFYAVRYGGLEIDGESKDKIEGALEEISRAGNAQRRPAVSHGSSPRAVSKA